MVFLIFAALCAVFCLLGILGTIPALAAVILGGLTALAAWSVVFNRTRTKGRPPDELAPRRERRNDVLPAAAAQVVNGSGRHRGAPSPRPPAADPGPVSVRPRFALPAGNMPPDHAAAQQRIASFEPEGLNAHVHFLIGEGKGLAGYVDAYGTYADGLIHGPGVPPEALKPLFDFAEMFAEAAAMAHLANKKVLDYFQGHLEWAETHDPTRDGHWTVRE